MRARERERKSSKGRVSCRTEKASPLRTTTITAAAKPPPDPSLLPNGNFSAGLKATETEAGGCAVACVPFSMSTICVQRYRKSAVCSTWTINDDHVSFKKRQNLLRQLTSLCVFRVSFTLRRNANVQSKEVQSSVAFSHCMLNCKNQWGALWDLNI